MGHQVIFYMNGEDLSRFEQKVKLDATIKFIHPEIRNSEMLFLETLRIPDMGSTRLRLFLGRESEVPLPYSPLDQPEAVQMVDSLRLPVIEFDRCYYDSTIIRRGRIFFHDGYWNENNEWVKKPESFLKWANSLLQWIRRHYTRDTKTGFYIGPYTQTWINENHIQLITR